MRFFLCAIAAGLALTAASATAATRQNCATIKLRVALDHPIAMQEACAGTITVNARINGRVPYDSQGFGKGNAGLIEYGYGASIRLYQGGPHKATIWVRATTSAPTAQRVTITLTPQTSTY